MRSCLPHVEVVEEAVMPRPPEVAEEEEAEVEEVVEEEAVVVERPLHRRHRRLLPVRRSRCRVLDLPLSRGAVPATQSFERNLTAPQSFVQAFRPTAKHP